MKLAITCSIISVTVIVQLSILIFMSMMCGIGVASLIEAVLNNPINLIPVVLSIGLIAMGSRQ